MAIIDYKNVEIHRNEHVALRGVNLNVKKGEFVYLLGKVGSGKTSLMKSMYAEVPVADGEASVLEYDLRTIDRSEIPFLRRRIGIVFQDFQLLTDRTAFANLDFVLRATGWNDRQERTRRIEEVLAAVGMTAKTYNMPHQMSGGEQQRVSIARAMAKNPKLLLCDEPTGALDYNTGKRILKLLYDVTKLRKKPVIVVTHNAALAAMADKVLHIKSGEIEKIELNENPTPIEEIEW